jgi:DNA-binding Lrp family transcriptional regulator
LESQKVILGYIYGIEMSRFGFRAYRFLICSRRNCSSAWNRLLEFARESPFVLCVIQCVGQWDFELIVEVESTNQLDAIAERLQRDFSDIVDELRRLPVSEFFKSGGFPFAKPAF